jgi:hypothetical protein
LTKNTSRAEVGRSGLRVAVLFVLVTANTAVRNGSCDRRGDEGDDAADGHCSVHQGGYEPPP